ncbi:MAG: RNA-binding transcriptional accessory protein [Candidatus Omnitrophica bacterium CG1_02_44_16]|nr:MAG: RNA-binding transcriptional accessory protein [Candidatus Omnitrophica bacterium CG1_02_44_16]PIY83623.1 MAG: RNA-binding transcriptional accessory protein [Candidatus Omnitrophica bacterium CG_4_10_14_0_8_um_filter_44_12]PIZ84762.1 MAG: RNA-binding transcriptional accessory protein [Candidatus Omnitrophica bacterium CG_4_10_14_0_2_um_filter_44_9]
MVDIPKILENEFSLSPAHTRNILQLLHEKATIPFMARYRKDMTGNSDEVKLRAFSERFSYLVHLEERKETVLKTIEEQGKLTPGLKARIDNCISNVELEDLYLPFKPKRRTRATQAGEKGLQGLADEIRLVSDASCNLAALAKKYVCLERGVFDESEALSGAADILAEESSEKSEYRDFIRRYFFKNGIFQSRAKVGFEGKKTKFEMYYNFQAKVSEVSSHNLLAILRGENEGVLAMQLVVDAGPILHFLCSQEIRVTKGPVADFLKSMLEDAYERLMRVSITADVRVMCKETADQVAIKAFETNLRQLLLSAPAGMRPVLGVDPGFVTGCKVVALDETGKFLEYNTIYPNAPQNNKEDAARTLAAMCKKHKIELIAIGNGTASRETESFVSEVIKALKGELEPLPFSVIVNESGASIYSASPLAAEEFPDKDATVRGSISIARRLQDPLAELVKIDPKSIGVGQYQHDVDQKKLKVKLEEVVESCVNFVGVDLNLASGELLSYVSGVNSRIAKEIVSYRNERGAFKAREELLKIPAFGNKTFEQAAGFLRIRDAANPLDNTAIHPESYPIVEKMCNDIKLTVEGAVEHPERLSGIKAADYVDDKAGAFTVQDIINELKKQTRDPREKFKYAKFNEAVKEIKDLKLGMKLEGTVTNVANFGAFVDIGVHQDGLVHISQIADTYVKDPNQFVKVGDVVKVTVLEVDAELKRISLSMKKKPEVRK